MHPDRGLVRTYRQLDSLSRRPQNRKPSMANPPIQSSPPRTRFTAASHGILPGHGPIPRYNYVCLYVFAYVYSLSRSPQALHCCIMSSLIVISGFPRQRHHRHQAVLCWLSFPIVFDSPVFLFDLTDLFFRWNPRAYPMKNV